MNSTINAVDFYKTGHGPQYPSGTEYVYSNLTPRSVKYASTDRITVFGIQSFIANRLIKEFNDTFFKQPLAKVLKKYQRRMDNALGQGVVSVKHIKDLHDLGYLPLRIKALPEGVSVKPLIPVMTMVNTLPEFFWLTNYIETVCSCDVWQPMTNMSVARAYFELLTGFANQTGVDPEFVKVQAHDFSMRGMAGVEAAAASGAAHLAAGFIGTDSVPAIDYLEDWYFADSDKEMVGCSVPATEHSVMCMGTKEDELATFERILDLYPAGIKSIVSDTWDLWKVITEYAPALREKIESAKDIMSYEAYDYREPCAGELRLAFDNGFRFARVNETDYRAIVFAFDEVSLGMIVDAPVLIVPGKTVFRPDSGDPVKILTGYKVKDFRPENRHTVKYNDVVDAWNEGYEAVAVTNDEGKDTYFEISTFQNFGRTQVKWYRNELSEHEVKGVVELLWEQFPGVVNARGYKELTKVGAIYGDSITLERAEQIMQRLKAKKFASNNVVLGIGSFTYQYNTRDTYGMAVKATWGMVDGVPREIFKDPITDDGTKKSATGLLRVELECADNKLVPEYVLYDRQTQEQESEGQLRTVFLDGIHMNQQTLTEIRGTR